MYIMKISIEFIIKCIPVNSGENNQKSCLISIIYEQSEDTNNKNKDLKTKIYYIALKTIL